MYTGNGSAAPPAVFDPQLAAKAQAADAALRARLCELFICKGPCARVVLICACCVYICACKSIVTFPAWAGKQLPVLSNSSALEPFYYRCVLSVLNARWTRENFFISPFYAVGTWVRIH